MITAFIVGIILGATGGLLINTWFFVSKPKKNVLPVSEAPLVESAGVEAVTKGTDENLITLVEDFKREQKMKYETLQKLTDDRPQNSETLKQIHEIEYDEAKFL